MPTDFWPLMRPFIVVAILLAAMYEPRKKRAEKRSAQDHAYEKEEAYDADYRQL